MQLNHLKQLQSTTSNEKIEEIKALILKTNSDIRLIIQNLRPTILDDLGLISAIKWVLENNLKSQGINYFFDYDNNIEDMRFSPFIEINVYRILQEVITNICKHAQAKEVHIKLVVNTDTLIVNIIDDGVGFDVNKILSQDINRMSDLKGIGLLGIYERASLLDGKISIMSKINSGTNITIVIPLNEVSVG
jgi:signal transduction histidine kinase